MAISARREEYCISLIPLPIVRLNASHSRVMTTALLSNIPDILCRCNITVRGPVSSLKHLYPTIRKAALSGTRLSSGNLDSRHTHGRRSSGSAVKAGLLDFFNRGGREKQQTELKESLLEYVKSLDRGADASPEDQDAVEAVRAPFISGEMMIMVAKNCN